MKRFFAVSVFVLILVSVFTKGVAAQILTPVQTSPTPAPTNKTVAPTQYPINANADVPQNLHTYTQSVVLELISALSCQLAGIDPLNPRGLCLGPDPKTGKLGFVQSRGAVGFLTDTIGMTFQIPLSSGQYLSHVASHFGIAKPALAQTPQGGFGFNALLSILPLWEAMRNIVYIFFVLIFVIVGIGIMFRLKIDPRSVMTIQGSLPKIVVGLILVTFSYAIAGFLVDMMYVTMYASYSIVSGASPNREIKNLKPADVQDKNPFYAAGAIYDENPIVGLPKLTQDAALGAVGILKEAAGIGDFSTLTDEEKKRLDASGKDGSSDPPTVTGVFASLFHRTPDVINGFFDQLPSVGPLQFLTGAAKALVGGILNGIGSIFDLAAAGEARTVSHLFNNSGGDTMLGRIIRTVSIAGGTYSGFQVGQMHIARIRAGGGVSLFNAEGGVECGPCDLALGVGAGIVLSPLIDSFLRTTLPNLIGFFIVLGIVITALLKLWFTLIKSYIYILLYVILAPFWIALGLIPGATSVGFSPWIRGLIANLAVFPVTYTMLLFAKILTEKMSTGGGFVPPLIGTQEPSLFASIFGIAILLAIPEILNTVKTALKVPSGKVGQSVGAGIGAGVGFTRAATAPATTRLIGHKNPMTGKTEGGIIPAIGKRAGENIASRFLPGIANNPTSRLRRFASQLAMNPVDRARAQERARDQAGVQQAADETRRNAIASALRQGQNPLQEPTAELDRIANENNITLGPDMSPDQKLEAIRTHAQANPETATLAARDIAQGRNPLQQLIEQFRRDLEAIARERNIPVNPNMNLQALLAAVNGGPLPAAPAAATGPAPTLTQEATELLEAVDAGGVPFAMTTNLQRILRENRISDEDINTRSVNELIEMLRNRRTEGGGTPPAPEAGGEETPPTT